MPIYEYVCPWCRHTEEQIDSRPSEYHRCNCGHYMKAAISAPSIIKVNGYSEANGYARKDSNDKA